MIADLEESVRRTRLRISPQDVARISMDMRITVEQLMLKLVPLAQTFARAPISNFDVGAVGLGRSGAIYLGTNLEFIGQALNQTVHGEQFLIARAMQCGEVGLAAIAVSAAPCGHCRQFLRELNGADELAIYDESGQRHVLPALLPRFLSPIDLGVEEALLSSSPHNIKIDTAPMLVQRAAEAARMSYAPYSNSPSGVALLVDGLIYQGSYAENVAFNPSLSPLQGALVEVIADGREPSRIEAAALVERDRGVSQECVTRGLLESVASGVELQVWRVS